MSLKDFANWGSTNPVSACTKGSCKSGSCVGSKKTKKVFSTKKTGCSSCGSSCSSRRISRK